jgi:hypothetical protein
MHLNERYQSHCRWCWKVHEDDSYIQAIRKTEEHERQCPRKPQAKEPAPREAAK